MLIVQGQVRLKATDAKGGNLELDCRFDVESTTSGSTGTCTTPFVVSVVTVLNVNASVAIVEMAGNVGNVGNGLVEGVLDGSLISLMPDEGLAIVDCCVSADVGGCGGCDDDGCDMRF